MENETMISKVAVVLSIIALFISLFAGSYAYFNQPEVIDLSDVETTVDSKVKLIEIKLDDLQYDIDDIEIIDLDDYIEFDDFWDELEDLEEMIEDNEDDINNNEDDIDDILDCIKDNKNVTDVRDCLS